LTTSVVEDLFFLSLSCWVYQRCLRHPALVQSFNMPGAGETRPILGFSSRLAVVPDCLGMLVWRTHSNTAEAGREWLRKCRAGDWLPGRCTFRSSPQPMDLMSVSLVRDDKASEMALAPRHEPAALLAIINIDKPAHHHGTISHAEPLRLSRIFSSSPRTLV
jgi:hypothetical protein